MKRQLVDNGAQPSPGWGLATERAKQLVAEGVVLKRSQQAVHSALYRAWIAGRKASEDVPHGTSACQICGGPLKGLFVVVCSPRCRTKQAAIFSIMRKYARTFVREAVKEHRLLKQQDGEILDALNAAIDLGWSAALRAAGRRLPSEPFKENE